MCVVVIMVQSRIIFRENVEIQISFEQDDPIVDVMDPFVNLASSLFILLYRLIGPALINCFSKISWKWFQNLQSGSKPGRGKISQKDEYIWYLRNRADRSILWFEPKGGGF